MKVDFAGKFFGGIGGKLFERLRGGEMLFVKRDAQPANPVRVHAVASAEFTDGIVIVDANHRGRAHAERSGTWWYSSAHSRMKRTRVGRMR